MADLLARAQAALASRFRVERELGRGGMATVFLAEDLKHSRLLAVKILHPDLAAAIGPEKFRSEIDFAAHLNHPHILPLIDSGEDDGLLWYAMPYVEGETLRERLQREGRLPLPDVADLAQQVASAMDYAHGLGILHRDIKPENLLLAHGHVWVADFGIAKALKQSAEASGAFEAGTPGYMSPEQMAGEPVDRRADVFSLGAVVYECLTGRRPFPDFERRKDLFGRRRRPGRLIRARPDVPPLMEAAVRTALAPVPSGRQATAGEFAQAVAQAVSDPKVEKAARSGWLRGGLVTFTVFAVASVAYYWSIRPPEYDDNRVVILPVQGPGGTSPGWGQDLAVALEAQLNSTRSLVARSSPGDSTVRATSGALDSAAARVAERQRARFSIRPRVEAGGSLLVTLWDHENNLQVEEAFRGPDESGVFARATEIATTFLPRLLPTGGQIDQSVFGGSSVEALAAFLQGERAYRAGSFHRADTLFSEAARLDPAFTWAALRGAQAASWVTEHGRALTLVQQALETTDSLGERYVAFARGLEDYQLGEADSAIVHL
ncbi:MAG TPA: serine/threonine-protein kinase, partial [Gemmatimonadales bacterium]